MATAEELLAVGESAENKVLIIDSDLRTISVPSDFGVFGVESDDDVLRVHFRGPRFYNGIDLSTFTLRVNVKNAEGNTDAYEVDDLEAEDNSITFSWLISRFVAHCAGIIKFALCFREIDEEGIVTREFNTTTAIGTILEGLEAEKEIEFEYPDLVERLRVMLERLESGGAGNSGSAGNGYVLTDDDKAEITKSVLTALPTWTGGRY